MLKKTLNILLIVFLTLSYLNRGLYVDMSEANLASNTHSKGEINSVLEFIIDLTGNANDIDEDGDTPEAYGFSVVEAFISQNFAQTLEQNNLFSKDIKRTFRVFSDLIFSQSVYGQIDHPPQG